MNRKQLTQQFAAEIERRQPARLQMLLVVSGAAAAGFLSSVLMLWLGLSFMAVRYALAVGFGYAAFLALMTAWLGSGRRMAARSAADRASDYIDLPFNFTSSVARGGAKSADVLFQGGRSGGAGASAAFDVSTASTQMPMMMPVPMPMPAQQAVKAGGKKLGGIDLGDDSAKVILPILAIVAISIGIVMCVSVVWSAPNLLAEILADGAVAGAAYQRLQRSERDWTMGVVRHTWKPALALFVTFVLLGSAGQYLKPTADSIGDFFR